MPRIDIEERYRASRLAAEVNGELLGPDVEVAGISSLEDDSPGTLTFAKRRPASPEKLRAAAIMLPRAAARWNGGGPSVIAVDDPLKAMVALVPFFFSRYSFPPSVSSRAEIHPSAEIGEGVHIGPFVWIGERAAIGDGAVIHAHCAIYPGARVGARTVIHSGATIREDCIIGADTVVQNGAVIGADGFGYMPDASVGLKPVPQIGIVELEDRADVGANACIDRATLGTTRVEVGAKIDNLVQVGHNCSIGRHAIICGQAGVAGSSKIGSGAVIGGAAGIADHLTIGAGVRVGAKAGVTGSLLEKGDYAGFPAIPAGDWRRQARALGELSGMLREIKKMLRRSDDQKEDG